MNESRTGLMRDVRGSVQTEYIAVVGLVAVGFLLAMAAIGPVMVERYQSTRSLIASPFP